jgi:translation initiation factor IF-3
MVNDQITASRVRLIAADGEQVGVVPIEQAMQTATDAELDLVEVSPDADPPVCKLMDYGKYRYAQKRKMHQAKTKSHATHVKEIRLHPKTGEHDIEYRLKHAREFLARGDKVLVSVLFKRREMAHLDVGYDQLQRVAEELADVAKVEMAPKRDGRRFTMMLVAK